MPTEPTTQKKEGESLKILDLLGVFVGCIGMSYAEFCILDFDEVDAIYGAWHQSRDDTEHSEWERTRTLAAISIQPHVKRKLTPRQLLPLPWDAKGKNKARHEKAELNADERKMRFERVAGIA